jgi:hypothetical protein
MDGLEVRHSDIDARRAIPDGGHDILDLAAFNTDGFDVTGKNVRLFSVTPDAICAASPLRDSADSCQTPAATID